MLLLNLVQCCLSWLLESERETDLGLGPSFSLQDAYQVLSRLYLRTFAPVIPAAWTSLSPDTHMVHSSTSFSSLLTCHCLRKAPLSTPSKIAHTPQASIFQRCFSFLRKCETNILCICCFFIYCLSIPHWTISSMRAGTFNPCALLSILSA